MRLRRQSSHTKLQNPYLGFVAGMVAGAVVAFVFAVAVIKFEADQVVAGFAIKYVDARASGGDQQPDL